MDAPDEIRPFTRSSKQSLRAWLHLIKCSKRVEQAISDLFRSRHASSLSRFDVLAHLEHAGPGGMTTSALAQRLLARCHQAAGPPPALTAEAQARLLAHPWPGNVRELDNVIQRALILCGGDAIGTEQLVFEPAEAGWGAAPLVAGEDLEDSLRQQEHGLILETLRAANGNRKAAAERVGISPRPLRYKLARMRAAGLDVPDGWRAACA